MGADFLLAETAPLQLHDRPLQLAVALPLQEVGGEVPVGGHGQGGGDLLAGPLPLLVLQSAGRAVLDRIAEVGLEPTLISAPFTSICANLSVPRNFTAAPARRIRTMCWPSSILAMCWMS